MLKTDSRKITKGDTFLALKGVVTDGHDYIEQAILNGASKVICERGSYDVETLIVPDTRVYLAKYLKDTYKKQLDSFKFIWITGTNGKTTSAYLIYQLLNKLGMNSRERNDFIVYWIRTLESMKNIEVTICDDSYNKCAPLSITNYSQQMRIFLLFHKTSKPYNEEEGVNRITPRQRPRGKYIVEWGGSVINWF